MANDLWRTPKEIYEKLDDEFNFVADMAANDDNHLHEVYFTEETNSLENNWRELVSDAYGYCEKSSFVYVNPPYSDPMPWIKKATEAKYDGLGTVMLLNADTSVGWFAEAYKTVSEIRFIIADEKEIGGYSSGRLAFLNDSDEPISGNNRPQFILVFNPFKIGERHTTYVTKSSFSHRPSLAFFV